MKEEHYHRTTNKKRSTGLSLPKSKLTGSGKLFKFDYLNLGPQPEIAVSCNLNSQFATRWDV